MKSITALLRDGFARLEDEAVDFFRGMDVTRGGRDFHSGVVLIRPDYWWASPTAQQQHQRMRLHEEFLKLVERLQVLVSKAPLDMRERVEDAREHLLEWIDLSTNWSLSDNRDETEGQVRSAFAPIRRTLDVLSQGASEIIVVPDTNAIALAPEPRRYEAVAGTPAFKLALVPAVLAELDSLKVTARSEEFRNRVAAAIRRIKGWRVQGPLLAGVTVDKTITVFAVAAEPDFSTSLSWLDRTNQDDRIVASVLELQRQHPAAVILLVTGDVNLQNKADAAGIPWFDLPEPVSEVET